MAAMKLIAVTAALLILAGCAEAEPPVEADNPFTERAPATSGKADRAGSLPLSDNLQWISDRTEAELADIFSDGRADAIPLGTNRGIPLLPSKTYLIDTLAQIYEGSTWQEQSDGSVLLRDNFGGNVTLFEGEVTLEHISDVELWRSPPPSGVSRPHWMSPYRRAIETDAQPSLFVNYQDDPTPLVNRILDEIREVHGRPDLYLGRAHFREPTWHGGRWVYLYYFALEFGSL